MSWKMTSLWVPVASAVAVVGGAWFVWDRAWARRRAARRQALVAARVWFNGALVRHLASFLGATDVTRLCALHRASRAQLQRTVQQRLDIVPWRLEVSWDYQNRWDYPQIDEATLLIGFTNAAAREQSVTRLPSLLRWQTLAWERPTAGESRPARDPLVQALLVAPVPATAQTAPTDVLAVFAFDYAGQDYCLQVGRPQYVPVLLGFATHDTCDGFHKGHGFTRSYVCDVVRSPLDPLDPPPRCPSAASVAADCTKPRLCRDWCVRF